MLMGAVMVLNAESARLHMPRERYEQPLESRVPTVIKTTNQGKKTQPPLEHPKSNIAKCFVHFRRFHRSHPSLVSPWVGLFVSGAGEPRRSVALRTSRDTGSTFISVVFVYFTLGERTVLLRAWAYEGNFGGVKTEGSIPHALEPSVHPPCPLSRRP